MTPQKTRTRKFSQSEFSDVPARKPAEGALSLFRSLIDQSNDAFEVIDPETGRFLDVNEKGCLDLGYSREEFLALSVSDIDPMVNRSSFKKLVEGFKKSGFMTWEGIHRRKDGSTFPVEVNLKYVRLDREYIVSVVRDITARKRAEGHLEMLKHSIDKHYDGAYWMDSNNKFVYVNDAGCNALGYKRKELIGMSLDKVNPIATAEAMKHVWEQLRTKGSYSGESIHCRKDGSEFPVEIVSTYVQFEGKEFNVGFARDLTERKRAQQAVQESQNRLNLFFDQTLDGVYFTMLDEPIVWNDQANKEKILNYAESHQRITEINDAMLAQYGATRESFLKRSLGSFFRHDVEQGRHLRRKLFDQGRLHIETSERKEDGTPIWIEGDYTCMYDEQHRIIGTFGIQRDITDRKQAELKLRESEEKFSAAFHASPNLIAITRMSDGTILEVNDGYSQLLGYSRAESIGKTTDELSIWANSVDRSTFVTNMEKYGQIDGFETTLRHKDGTILTVIDSARIIEFGGKDCVLSVVHDITERKKAEEKLRLSEERFRSMFDKTLDGVYRSTHEGRFVEVNPAFVKMFGYSSKEELMNIDIKKELYFSPEERGSHVLDSGKEETEVYLMRRKDGSPIWVEDHGRYVHDEQGNVIFHDGVLRDVTERKRAEKNIAESKALLTSIIDSTNDLIWSVDSDRFSLLTFNKGLEDFFKQAGIQIKEGMLLEEIVPGELAKKLNHLYWQTLQEGFLVTKYQTTIGNRVLWMNLHVLSRENVPYAISVFAKDITEREKAEREIEHLASFPRVNPEPIVEIDYSGAVTFINPAARSFLNHMSIENVTDILPTDLDKILNTIKRKKETLPFRREVVIKDRFLDETIVSTPVFDTVRIYCRDITDRKFLEEELSYLTHAIEQSPVSVVITNAAGDIEYVNPKFTEITGYTKDEALGKNPRILKSGEKGSEEYKYLWETITTGGEWRGEFHNKKKNGELFWEAATISPVRNEKGVITHFIAIKEDITERKAAQELLHRSEEHLRNVLENLRDVVYTISPLGILTSLSPAFTRITGWAVDEWIGKSFIGLVHPDDILYLGNLFKRVLTGESPSVFEGRITRKDGGYVTAEFLASPQRLNNKIVGVLGIARDVSDRKAADEKQKMLEGQLFQTQKLDSLGTLASGIAHDFNNILSIIIGNASLLERISAVRPTVQKNVEAIMTAGMRGADLVKQMLTFARKSDILMESIMLNDVVNEVLKLLYEIFPKTITIDVLLDKKLPLVIADATQVHQVVLNLCVNARDAMPDGGILTITTHLESGEALQRKHSKAVLHEYIVLRVADNGIGMNEETQRRIFEPFFTTKERGKGTGLGLSLVFGIMESHNGFVAVESEVGKGTTFSCFFPVPEKTQEFAQGKELITEEVRGGSETILVVEDEEMLREVVKVLLESKGYAVLTAGDGKEGLDVYQRHQKKIDLVISDFGLPGFNGDELYRRLVKMNSQVRMILASGYIEPGLKVMLIGEGLKDFIQKPYESNKVLRAIRDGLDTP